MQTFLPFPDFKLSASVLDNKRLGKQRVEAWQILRALAGLTKGWRNHPATLMWKGHEQALAVYGVFICNEWTSRGFRDSMTDRFINTIDDACLVNMTLPSCFGRDDFHASHRSNLLRKAPDYYGKFGWLESNDLPYVWS